MPKRSGPDCATPPLAQASRQLREEVIPVWLETNIFRLVNATEIRKWLPLTTSIALINSIILDLESSVMWYHTLKHYDIQPTKIVIPFDHVIVDDISVVWASHARIIESLATNPRRGAFKAISELSGLLDSRRELDEERVQARLWEAESGEMCG